jgi:membrane-associated phospholipid phosphatase
MAYTSLYLLSHLPTLLPFHRISLHLPNIFFGFLPISLALWVGITRIEDYRHNPTDVMGGAIVGCFFATVGWIAFGRRGAKAWRRSLGDFGDREGRDYVEEPEPGYERVVGDPAAV